MLEAMHESNKENIKKRKYVKKKKTRKKTLIMMGCLMHCAKKVVKNMMEEK